jgi:hypothetical protein
MDLTELFHTPHEKPSRSHPRTVTIFKKRGVPGTPWTDWAFAAEFGCSDEWLTSHPNTYADLDAEDVQERLTRDKAPMAYEEGEEVQLHVVLHHFGQGVVAERSYKVTGFGRVLSSGQCAALAKVQPGTWRSYVTRGQAPAADVPDEAWLGMWQPSGPHWRESTVRHWLENRLGSGYRSDLETE